MNKHLRNLFLSLMLIITAFFLVSCCEDDETKLPVSDVPIDEITCDMINVSPLAQSTGKPVQINCAEEFQRVEVEWEYGEEMETIVKTGSTIVGYHIYLIPGDKIVKVRAYNKYGYLTQCQCTVSITGNNNPVTPEGTHLSITASPSYGKPPLSVNFTYTFSADDGATAKSVLWDFGDGNTSTLPTPTNVYNVSGSFNVSCSVTDTKGRVSTAITTVVAKTDPTPDPGNLPPTINITSDKITVDVSGTVHFTGTASDPDGTIANYEWVLGDGGSESGASKTTLDHLYYNTAGASCNAYCVVTDDKGATAQSNTITITVKANQAPTVISVINGYGEGSTPTVDKGDTVIINMCNSTDPNSGDSISGSRYSSSGLTPTSNTGTACQWTTTANTSGTISVVLHVTDSYGKESSAKSRQIIVKEPVYCEYSGYTIDNASFDYSSISWTKSFIPTQTVVNNPEKGHTYRKVYDPGGALNYSSADPYMIAANEQTTSGKTGVVWRIRVNGTNCVAGDTLTVKTVLSGALTGDTNANQEDVEVNVGQYYNYTIQINSKSTGSRTWRFYVEGAEQYNNILRNDI